MPAPKRKGDLWFKGKEVEAFLLTYESKANSAGLTETQKCKQLTRYVSRRHRELIKGLPEVLRPTNFSDLKDHIIKLYITNDRQYYYTREKLAEFCGTPRVMKKEKHVDQYYRTFLTHIQNLTTNHQISDRDRDHLFWSGVPVKVRLMTNKLLETLPGYSELLPMPYTEVYEQLKRVLNPRRYYGMEYLRTGSSKPSSKSKKRKAKTSYYNSEDSDSDSEDDSSSDEEITSNNDESDSDSDSSSDSESDSKPKSKRATKVKKVKILKKPSIIPATPDVNDQLIELKHAFKDMQVQLANSLAYNMKLQPQYQTPPQPLSQPLQSYSQVPPQSYSQPPPQSYSQPPSQPYSRPPPPQTFSQPRTSPATSPNNMPLRTNRFQNANIAPRSNVCWFCDKVGTHLIGMQNCSEAQAMVSQGLIKYSLNGKLVKQDGSNLPRGIPGQGGVRQAIITEINHFKTLNSGAANACSLVNERGVSPFTVRTYAIEGDSHWSSPAKANPPASRPNQTSFLPKRQVIVEIPRRVGPLNPANKLRNPPEVPAPAQKVPTSSRVPRQDAPISSHPPGILPASVLREKTPGPIESTPTPARAPIDTMDIDIQQPEQHIPKAPSAYRFTTDYQEACDEREVVGKILDQKIEISIGDFLGSAIGPAKILASGLKLKREYNGKSRTPFTINSGTLDTPYIDSDDDSDDDDDDIPSESIAARFNGSQSYQTNLVQTAGPQKLLAMATGKISVRVTGQGGTADLLALIDTGSEINLISKDAAEQLNLPMNLEGSEWSLQGINSGPEPLYGCCHEVPIKVGGKNFVHHFFVKNGTFNDHDILLGQPWLGDYKTTIIYGIDAEGKRTMTVQAQEHGGTSIISLQALMNGSRQQTKLVANVTADSPTLSPRIPDSLHLPPNTGPRLQHNSYQFYRLDATPSTLSLSGDSPSIPSLGRNLSEAM